MQSIGAGGKYLTLPPDYKATPPEGYIARKSETFPATCCFAQI